LPWSKEEENLASSKLSAFSQNLSGMMHEVNVRHNDKGDQEQHGSCTTVINNLTLSFPSLTPIS
jgi:hypothetical protein